MKLVPESLNEVNFERGQNPKAAMGIGRTEKLYKDLEEAGFEKDQIEISDNFIIYPTNKKGVSPGWGSKERIQSIALNHMEEKFVKFAESLGDIHTHSVKGAIEEAIEDGLSEEEILLIAKHYSANGNIYGEVKIYTSDLFRDDKKKEEDDEENIYLFIGFMDKKPVEVNGKTYYEDKFSVESMVKVDKYDPGQLSMVHPMKIRARYQYPDGGNVYMLKVPNYVMDEDHYSEIPDHLQEIVEKYKVKL